MLVAERHTRIVSSLRAATVASTEELAHQLEVSAETIRRDLVTLEQQGALTRIRGGAAIGLPSLTGQEPAFVDRTGLAAVAKERIGRAAAALAPPGGTLVVDVGTTALAVARSLPAAFNGTVATCSLLAAVELSHRPDAEVLVSGGRLRPGDLALSNGSTAEFFADFYSDVAFLGSGGVHADAGLTDYHLDEAAVRRTIIRNAAAAFVLADATKLGRIARHRVVALRGLAGLITDEEPPGDIRAAIEDGGGRVIVAEGATR
ncbi:transcriptional regulator, DeoR family [Nakamurella panacisegetis]|uniref:Lactose phosphotransferase system repressor n=1 Tax=Nakamurella panacisegetis TaxID=1090615 RepID=A0A1H0M3I4_9ACTN|nr:DeoR/GlpR family DNA-binding transcription regulator [Nakamurella panacisegetis]SDO74841.1 transcriptional regulator, DeoR family [Nakamurella panacisegetis]